MLLYRLRARILQFEGVRPPFPADVVVNVELAPEVPFGGVAGISRNAVTDTPVKGRANLITGRFALDWSNPLFEPLRASIKIGDTAFEMRRNVITVRSRCMSEQDLDDLLSAIFYAFPAVLNIYIPDAPFPIRAWGQVGTAKFNWLFEPTEAGGSCTVTSKENQERLVTDAWRNVAVVAPSRRLMGGLYYFHVACRLLAVGHERFEFVAEALLNLAKSLQSLFGQSRDEVRFGIEKLSRYNSADIEGKFLPAMVLRDEFDVAHVSLSMLKRDQLRTLHDFTNIAEDAFRDLQKAVLMKLNSGEYVLAADPPSDLPGDKRAILRRLRKNIRPFCQ